MIQKIVLVITLSFCFLTIAYSQQPTKPSTQSTVQVPDATQDTSQYAPQPNRYGLFKSFSGKPGKASLIGLVVPGGGQIYNRKYIKAAVLLGAEVTLLTYAFDRRSFFKSLDSDFKFMVDNPGLPGPNFGITELDIIINEKESARQTKDIVWMVFGGVHLFVIAEAFVDRHLMEFDVSDDLSIKLNPSPVTGLTLAYQLD